MAKIKKWVSNGDYRINIYDNNSVLITKSYPSIIAGLRAIAKAKKFKFDENWTTQQFGKNLLDKFCDGDKEGTIGEFTVKRDKDNKISLRQVHKNTIGALREISKKEKFKFDEGWTTQQFGAKLVDFLKTSK